MADLDSSFTPRKRNRLLAGLRHSRRVAVLRIALPVAAALVLATVFLWPMAESRRIIALPPAKLTPQLTMEQPRFTGTDDQNRPFTVQAKQAIQSPKNLMLVDLVSPQATLSMADGTPITGSATMGRFDQTKKRLWLGGAVDLQQGDAANAMTFNTSELFADLTARTVWGDKPARVTGAFGSIEGQGFRVYDGGKVMLFTGASRAILNDNSGVAMPVPLIAPAKE